MSRGRSVKVATRTDQLSGIDHGILGLLQAHRVLTTPQLITLAGRPERTIDYRLARLRERSLVDRIRPYAASGSAPFYWWLTSSGARLVEGTSPAPGKSTPNPLFLRHTAAIAGLYVALLDAGPSVGLTLSEWSRDEDAWEDWSNYHGAGRLRPDAYAEVRLDVDGAEGVTGAFVEVDFATMDQARLRAKVARHRGYCAETVWWDRHPCCPALLLVTTSEARVNHFLAGVELDRPRPSPYQREHPAHYDELVAACATVASPEEAVVAPVWRAAVADAPVMLAQLLSPEVRQYRRVVARVDAARQVEDDQYRLALARDLVRDADAIADAIGDPEAGAAVGYVLGTTRGVTAREGWAAEHPDLVDATAAWWAAARTTNGSSPPIDLLGAWWSLYRDCWLAQADALLEPNEAVRLGDPRVRRPAAALAAGELVDDFTLQRDEPIDGRAALEGALAEYERRRTAAVTATIRDLPLHRRVRVDRTDLDAAYDAEHLYVCTSCALPSGPDDEATGRAPLFARCRCCDGPLVPFIDAPDLPPPLDDSLARIASRRQLLRSRP